MRRKNFEPIRDQIYHVD